MPSSHNPHRGLESDPSKLGGDLRSHVETWSVIYLPAHSHSPCAKGYMEGRGARPQLCRKAMACPPGLRASPGYAGRRHYNGGQLRCHAVLYCTSCTGASVHEALNRRQLVIVEKAGQRSGGGVATVTRLQTDRRESQLLASAVASPIALQSGQRQADSGELFNWERVSATGRVTGTGRNAIPKSQPPLHTTGLELLR